MAQGRPVVFVAKNGMPVTYSANGYGTPVTEATNKQGVPVTVIAKGGYPIVDAGAPPAPAGFILLVDQDGAYLTDQEGTYLMEAL